MAKRTKEYDAKAFLKAFEELGSKNGVSREVILDALKEAFKIAVTKKLEDEDRIFIRPTDKAVKKVETKLNDALVRCDIDLEKGTIGIYRQFKVVNDDDIEDDFIEIGLTEAKEKDPNLKIGDYYEEPFDLKTFTQYDVSRFKTAFNQKLSQAEKAALLEIYKSKVHELVTGTVEKADQHEVIVNLGRTSATLYKEDLIGNETFKPGDSIKVYIQDISDSTKSKSDSLIRISRSCPGFLEKLFENEVHEIYDGTVKIEKIARKAGVRSKVCVSSKAENIDPSGACIGQNGNRIQAIVSQLGNARDSKEKIDVITYHDNLGLFLSECLKPGVMLGANIDYENKSAVCITQDGTSGLAIGSKKINLFLTKQLTGLVNLEIKDESEVPDLEYTTVEEFAIQAREEEKRKFREESLKLHNKDNSVKKAVTEETNFTDKDEYEEDYDQLPVEDVVTEKENVETTNEVNEPETKVEETEKVEEPEVKVAPAPKKVVEPIEKAEVRTTTTLESLEKSLEEEKQKEKSKEASKSKKKKDHKENKDAHEENEPKKEVKKMAIYTDEELADFDDELDEEDSTEDEEDYSEYDSDSYYDN